MIQFNSKCCCFLVLSLVWTIFVFKCCHYLYLCHICFNLYLVCVLYLYLFSLYICIFFCGEEEGLDWTLVAAFVSNIAIICICFYLVFVLAFYLYFCICCWGEEEGLGWTLEAACVLTTTHCLTLPTRPIPCHHDFHLDFCLHSS
jgi:hypothetical protein